MILAEAMRTAKQMVNKANFMEIRYERLCAEPLDVFKEVTKFCELQWSEPFENRIKQHRLRSANEKWRMGLTQGQQEIAEYFTESVYDDALS